MSATGVVKALRMIKDLPRVVINNVPRLPNDPVLKRQRRKCFKGGARKRKRLLALEETLLPPIGNKMKPVPGFIPYYIRIPKEPYYENHGQRKQYPHLSLYELQRAIDLGRLDVDEPIDLIQLVNTKLWKLDLSQKHYGFNLIDEGIDVFKAKINLEVQWTNEAAISAIERNGGCITTRFYDPVSLSAMIDSEKFFRRACPIPKCKYPTMDVISYYYEAKNRGYLADTDDIKEARLELAQKYGYTLPDMTEEPLAEMLSRQKDPIQIFYGLRPGWVVLLEDKQILKPTSKEWIEFYN